MGRTIITTTDVRNAAAASPSTTSGRVGVTAAATADDYKDRLIKYIPADVIAAYLTLDGIARGANPVSVQVPTLRWAIFLLVLVATPLYLRRIVGIEKWKQVAVCVGAFIVWAVSLPNPIITWPDPVYPALLLPVYTFLIPLLKVEALPGETVKLP